MRIPITMSHGVPPRRKPDPSMTDERLDQLMQVAGEMGCASIDYDQLAAWRSGAGTLPSRPIMIDFDHPCISMRYVVKDVLDRYGFAGNLFIHTGPLVAMHAAPLPPDDAREWMTWEEIGHLIDAGWHIGSHTATHPNLSRLSLIDPDGARLREELDRCDETLQRELGVVPADFAYTSTSWSTVAEREVTKRYRFARLWIVGARKPYHADGKVVRFADLVGAIEPDEADGGPPEAVRYITEDSHPHRLPAMDLVHMLHRPETFRRYLERALV